MEKGTKQFIFIVSEVNKANLWKTEYTYCSLKMRPRHNYIHGVTLNYCVSAHFSLRFQDSAFTFSLSWLYKAQYCH